MVGARASVPRGREVARRPCDYPPAGARQLGGRPEGPQARGQSDGAVLALAVLQQRDERAPHGDGGAVERVEGLRLLVPAHADVQAPGLVVGGVGAGGELAVATLAGQPRLAVVLLGGRGAEVAHGDVDDAVGQAESGEDLLLDREDALVLGAGVGGLDEAEHLHLVELVHAEDAARVFAGGAGLAAEAGREAGVAQRQALGVEDLLVVQRGERDLGGAHEVELVLGQAVDLLLGVGQEAGAEQRPLAHEHRRDHRLEAVAAQLLRAPSARARAPAAPGRPSGRRSARRRAWRRGPCRSSAPPAPGGRGARRAIRRSTQPDLPDDPHQLVLGAGGGGGVGEVGQRQEQPRRAASSAAAEPCLRELLLARARSSRCSAIARVSVLARARLAVARSRSAAAFAQRAQLLRAGGRARGGAHCLIRSINADLSRRRRVPSPRSAPRRAPRAPAVGLLRRISLMVEHAPCSPPAATSYPAGRCACVEVPSAGAPGMAVFSMTGTFGACRPEYLARNSATRLRFGADDDVLRHDRAGEAAVADRVEDLRVLLLAEVEVGAVGAQAVLDARGGALGADGGERVAAGAALRGTARPPCSRGWIWRPGCPACRRRERQTAATATAASATSEPGTAWVGLHAGRNI